MGKLFSVSTVASADAATDPSRTASAPVMTEATDLIALFMDVLEEMASSEGLHSPEPDALWQTRVEAPANHSLSAYLVEFRIGTTKEKKGLWAKQQSTLRGRAQRPSVGSGPSTIRPPRDRRDDSRGVSSEISKENWSRRPDLNW